MPDKFNDDLQKVCNMHDDFSANLKKFEQVFEIEAPTVSGNNNTGFFNNDLRYALRASIDLLKNEDIKLKQPEKSRQSLNILSLSVQILYNDLFDYTVRFINAYIKDLYQDCSVKIVNSHLIDEISITKNLIKGLNPKIVKSRKHRGERHTIYQKLYQNEFLELLNAYAKILDKVSLVRLEAEEHAKELATLKEQLKTAKEENRRINSVDSLKTIIAFGSFLIASLTLITIIII